MAPRFALAARLTAKRAASSDVAMTRRSDAAQARAPADERAAGLRRGSMDEANRLGSVRRVVFGHVARPYFAASRVGVPPSIAAYFFLAEASHAA